MAANILHDAALHRAKLQDALANIAGEIENADRIYENDRSRWAIEWDDLASIGSEIRVMKKDDFARFDTSIFGPALKATTKEGQAKEICEVLLAKDKDFSDALINIDRDNFLSNPYDSVVHDVNLLRAVGAGIYAVNRGLFLAMNAETAMTNVHYYRFMIRHLRSQLYLANLIAENVERLSERTFNLEVVKEKYEATIFTLRRQLDDYHKAHGAVGKNADGQIVVNESTGRNALHSMIAAAANAANTLDAVNNGGAAAAVLAGLSTEDTTSAYVVIQIEELGSLRSRHRQVMEKAIEHCKQIMLTTANGFDARRTNYHEENEKRDSHNLPTCYMFKITDPHNAISFALELQNELNTTSDWPKQLLEMKRFGGDPLWKGLRIRIGVHYGEASLVESPEGTIVQHYEGVVVDKAMRLASLAACGECLVSKAAWEAYQQTQKEGKIPPSKRYQSLRTMLIDKVDSGRKRGFKRDEYYLRLWPQTLAVRKDSKPSDGEVEFGHIYFFGLEIGATVEESDEPTAEDLLQAKDTEITLLQQELDNLRLAIIKRDSDIEEIRTHMFSHINQLNTQTNAKLFYHERTAQSLESQLMRAHDTLARCSHITAGAQIHSDERRKSSSQARKKSSSVFESSTEAGESEQPEVDGGGDFVGLDFDSETPFAFGNDGDVVSLEELDRKRAEEFEAWTKANSGAADVSTLGRTRSNVSSFDSTARGSKKHNNQKLWRELNQLITGATIASKAAPPNPKPRKSNAGHQADGGDLNSTLSGKDPTVVQKIHSLVRVYAKLIKRFSQVKNESDIDDQALNEDQFIQLFLKLTNSDQIGSARETFHLCMQTAIESEEIEAANAVDDSRLMRSIIGHFVKIFLVIRTFKKRAVIDANLFDEEGNLREANEKIIKKASKVTKRTLGSNSNVETVAVKKATSSSQQSVPANAPHLGGSFRPAKLSLTVTSPTQLPPSRDRDRDSGPTPNLVTVNKHVSGPTIGSSPTVSGKHAEQLERQNAQLARDLAQKNERLEDVKTKSARDDETIKILRDELRKIKQDGEQRVKAAVNAALSSQKDTVLPRESALEHSTQPRQSPRFPGGGGVSGRVTPPSVAAQNSPSVSTTTSPTTLAIIADKSSAARKRNGAATALQKGSAVSSHSEMSPTTENPQQFSKIPAKFTPRGEENASAQLDSGRDGADSRHLSDLSFRSSQGMDEDEESTPPPYIKEYDCLNSTAKMPEYHGDEVSIHPPAASQKQHAATTRVVGERSSSSQPLCYLELLLDCYFAEHGRTVAIARGRELFSHASADGKNISVRASAKKSEPSINDHVESIEISNRSGLVKSFHELAAQDPSLEEGTAALRTGAGRAYLASLGLAHAIRAEMPSKATTPAGDLIVTSTGASSSTADSHHPSSGSPAALRREVSSVPLAPLHAINPRGQTSAMQTQMMRDQQQHALMLIQQQQQQHDALPDALSGEAVVGRGAQGPSVKRVPQLSRQSSGLPIPMRRLPNILNPQDSASNEFAGQHVQGLGIGPSPSIPTAKIGLGEEPATSALQSISAPVHVRHSFQVIRPEPQDLSIRSELLVPSLISQRQQVLRKSVHSAPITEATVDGEELRFAMTRAENEAVLLKAAEERRAYYDQQKRLQDQLAELRALQQHSQTLLKEKSKGIPHSIRKGDAEMHSSDQSGVEKEVFPMEITRIIPVITKGQRGHSPSATSPNRRSLTGVITTPNSKTK